MPVKTIMSLVMLGIVYLIVSAYKKVDKTVDEYKLKRNPDDIPTLEKLLLSDIIAKNDDHAWEVAEHILEIDPNNLLALIYQAVLYHECEEYENSKPILKRIEPQLSDSGVLQALKNKFFSLTDGKKMDLVMALIAKGLYFNGHILFMAGQIEQANQWKKKAKGFDRSALDLNLY